MNEKIQRRWFGKTKIESRNVINVLSSYIYEIKKYQEFEDLKNRLSQ